MQSVVSPNPLRYWRQILRFSLTSALPRSAEELPLWALCVPIHAWNKPVRTDGRTFADLYARGVSWHFILYFVFLLMWPFVALGRTAQRQFNRWLYWKVALSRPEFSMQHPNADFRENDLLWARPDYTLGMFYAYWFSRPASPDKEFFTLDDKRVFDQRLRSAGYAMPERVEFEQACQEPDAEFVVKDATSDLGFGVSIETGRAISQDETLNDPTQRADFVIQRRLQLHPQLAAIFPKKAPLSSLRVMTMLDPRSGRVRAVRTAIRIGRDRMPVDNTQQGGIWARVELDSGIIQPGVTREDFGTFKNGEPQRHSEHPDSKLRFAGETVPHFEAGKRMAILAHEQLAPAAPSLGWDIALCAGEPVLLEVNVWTVLYDYDPDEPLFEPMCELMLQRLRTL